LLTGKSEEDIYNSSIDEYREMAKSSAFLTHPYDGEVLTAKTYNIGKWVLQPVEDFRKITTAQYIDFQTFAQLGKDKVEEKIVEIISVMLVPKGKKYNQDYDVLEVQNAIREYLSVAEAVSLFAFFFVQYKLLIKDSLTSCKEAAMKLRDPEKKKRALREIQKQEEILLKGGDGFRM
jgi:parvulin-like peptidyl-prolyl isomerase